MSHAAAHRRRQNCGYGDPVGIADGAVVGATLRGRAGVAVGAGVGATVGTTLGARVGAGVGIGVGATVGTTLGARVGTTIGSRVGATVGTTLGARVGAMVGSGVGAACFKRRCSVFSAVCEDDGSVAVTFTVTACWTRSAVGVTEILKFPRSPAVVVPLN
jgi:hypothetical protein